MSGRTQYVRATADTTRSTGGVAIVGSYQMNPATTAPFKVRGVKHTAKTTTHAEIALTAPEAQKLVKDWISMGLFGRHGRVVTTKAAA